MCGNLDGRQLPLTNDCFEFERDAWVRILEPVAQRPVRILAAARAFDQQKRLKIRPDNVVADRAPIGSHCAHDCWAEGIILPEQMVKEVEPNRGPAQECVTDSTEIYHLCRGFTIASCRGDKTRSTSVR